METSQMQLLDTMRKIYDLATKGATIELQKTILDLKREVLAVANENVQLREELLRLTNAGADSGEVKWEGDAYWTVQEDGSKDGPFCQVCYDSSRKLCRLYYGSESDPDYAGLTHYYLECRVCSGVFENHNVDVGP